MSGTVPPTAAFLQLLQTGRVEEARELLRRDGSKAVEAVSILEEVFPCMLTTVAESYDTHGVTGHEKPFFDLARELWYLMPQAERDIVDMLVTFVYAGCKFNQVDFVKWVLPIALRHPLVDMYALTVDRMAEFNQLRHSALYYVCKNGSIELYDVLAKAVGGTPPVVLETRVFDHLVASALRVGARPPVPVYRAHGGDAAGAGAEGEGSNAGSGGGGDVSARSGRSGSEPTEASSAAIATGDDSSVKRPEEPDPPSLYAALREGHSDFVRHVLGGLSPSEQGKVLRTLVVHGIIPMDDAATAEQLFSLCAQPPLDVGVAPLSARPSASSSAAGSPGGAGATSSLSEPATSTSAPASSNPSPAVSRRASAVSLVDSETLVCALAAARHVAPLAAVAAAAAPAPLDAAAAALSSLSPSPKPLHQRHEYLALHLCVFLHETCADAAYVRPRPAQRYATWLLSTLPLVATQPVNGMKWGGASRYAGGPLAPSSPPPAVSFPYAHADRDILTRPRWKDPYGSPFVFSLESERSRAGSGSMSGSAMAGGQGGLVPPSPSRGGAGSVIGGAGAGLPPLSNGGASELSAWVAWTPLHSACAASCLSLAEALVGRDAALVNAPSLLLLPGGALGGGGGPSSGSTGGPAVLSVPGQQCHPIRVAVEAVHWTHNLSLTSWLLHFLAPVQLDAQLYQPCKALAAAKPDFIKEVCKDTTLSLRAFRSGGLMGPGAVAAAAPAPAAAAAASTSKQQPSSSKRKQVPSSGGGSSGRRRQSSAAAADGVGGGAGGAAGRPPSGSAGSGGGDALGTGTASPVSPAVGIAGSDSGVVGGGSKTTASGGVSKHRGGTEGSEQFEDDEEHHRGGGEETDPHEERCGGTEYEDEEEEDEGEPAGGAVDSAEETSGYRGGRAGSSATHGAADDDSDGGEWEAFESSRRRRGASGVNASGGRGGGGGGRSGKGSGGGTGGARGGGRGDRSGGTPRHRADTATSDAMSVLDSDFDDGRGGGHHHSNQGAGRHRSGSGIYSQQQQPPRRSSGRLPPGVVAAASQAAPPAGGSAAARRGGGDAAAAAAAASRGGHIYRGRAKSEGAEVLLARGGLGLLLAGDASSFPAPAAASAVVETEVRVASVTQPPLLQRPQQQHQHRPHRLNAIAEAMSRETSLAHMAGGSEEGRPATPTALPGALPRSKSTRGSFPRLGSGLDATTGSGSGGLLADALSGGEGGEDVIIVARGGAPGASAASSSSYEGLSLSPTHSSDVLGLRRAGGLGGSSGSRTTSRGPPLSRHPLSTSPDDSGLTADGGYEYPDPLLGIPLDAGSTPVGGRNSGAVNGSSGGLLLHPAVTRLRGEGGSRASRSPSGRTGSGRRDAMLAEPFAGWDLGFTAVTAAESSTSNTRQAGIGGERPQQPPPLLPVGLGPPPGLHPHPSSATGTTASGAPSHPGLLHPAAAASSTAAASTQQQMLAAFALLSQMLPGGPAAAAPPLLRAAAAGGVRSLSADSPLLTPAALAHTMQSYVAPPAAAGSAGSSSGGLQSPPALLPVTETSPPPLQLAAAAVSRTDAAQASTTALQPPASPASGNGGLPRSLRLPLTVPPAAPRPRYGAHGSTVVLSLSLSGPVRLKRLDVGNTFPALPAAYAQALQALGSRGWWPSATAAGGSAAGVARVLFAEGLTATSPDDALKGCLVSEWFDATLVEVWPKGSGTGAAESPLKAGAASSAALPLSSWPFPARVSLCRQLAEGLVYLHARGFPHGGIRPSNVGVCASPPTQPSHPEGVAVNAALTDPGLALAALGAGGTPWPLRLRLLQALLQASSGYLPAEVLAVAHEVLESGEPEDAPADAAEHKEAGMRAAAAWGCTSAAPAWQLTPSDTLPPSLLSLLAALAAPASDVFALGCLFAVVLGWTRAPGAHPFGTGPFRDANVMSGKALELRVPTGMEALGAVVQAMLTHDPASRPTAGAVAAALMSLERSL